MLALGALSKLMEDEAESEREAETASHTEENLYVLQGAWADVERVRFDARRVLRNGLPPDYDPDEVIHYPEPHL